MTRIVCALALALAAWTLPATAAHAATYCVSAPAGCSGITPAPDTIQQAITLATEPTTPEDDTIIVDAGTFPANHIDVGANTDGRLTIQGAGPTQTLLTRTPAEAEVRVQDDDATLSGVGIVIPTAFFSRALTLYRGRAEDLRITEGAGSASNTGVVMGEGAVAADMVVDLPSEGSAGAEVFFAGDGRIVDSTLNTCTGVYGNTPGTVTVERVKVHGAAGFVSAAGNLVTDSSSVRIDARGVCTNNLWGVASTGNFSAGRSLTVLHTTVVGAGQSLSRGVRLQRNSGADPLLAIAKGSLFTGIGQTIESTTATADPIATMKFSASGMAASATSQPGYDGGSFPNVLDPVVGFVDQAAGDYRLTHASTLIDRGELPSASASSVDLAGEPRNRDGKPNVEGTTARPDIGAFEYVPGLPSVAGSATPASARRGTPIAFSATGDAGDPGEAVSYAWAFDDGTTATGASVSKSFAAAGAHSATVTATDASGWTATDTVPVTVTAPPATPTLPTPAAPAQQPGATTPPALVPPSVVPPATLAFRVAFVRRTSTVDRRGRAPVGLRCPASAPRRCAGRLTLSVVRRVRGRRRSVVVGRASFSIAPGRTATPRVRLTRTIRSLMRRSRRFTVRAEATVTGGQAAGTTLVVRSRQR